MKNKIKYRLKKILMYLGVMKKPRFEIKIVKCREECFSRVKYKGTSEEMVRKTIRVGHPETRIGSVTYGKHVSIRNSVVLDIVGDISIGDYVIFSDNVSILTHDHRLKGDNLIMETDEEEGVTWASKTIGSDVYFGLNSIVTMKVTNIPDGVVIGAGSVLTKNPGAYEIWAGNPAKKVGDRLKK